MRHQLDCPRYVVPDDDWETKCECSYEVMRARVRNLEKALRLVLSSATPHPNHHPKMSAAWIHAQNVLEKKL